MSPVAERARRAVGDGLRLAVAADAPSIDDLVQRAYAVYLPRLGGVRPAPMDADYDALIARGLVTVLVHDGRIAGVLVLMPAADHLLLDNVAVDPECRGRGFGRTLIAHAETRARQLGMPELRLYTNEKMIENQAMYVRLGFVETGRAEQDGRRRVFMAKSTDHVQ